MTTLRFPAAEVRKLVDHAKAATSHRETYGQRAKPGLILVGDQGVYLMSSGQPILARTDGKDGSVCVYAEGINAETDEFDDWWAAKREAFGGNDGAELLPLADVEAVLAEWEKVRSATFKLDVSPTSIGMLVPVIEKPKRKPGLAAGLGLPSLGLVVSLDGRDVVSVASFREASARCQSYIDKHGLGARDWSGGTLKLDGKAAGRVSYNGRVWNPEGDAIDGDALNGPCVKPKQKRAKTPRK